VVGLRLKGFLRTENWELRTVRSAPPPQRNRTAHWMAKFAAGLLHLQHRALQREVSLCGTVSVVDQHQVRIVLDRMPRSPPPSLVNERSVSGIHQTDNAVIHRAGQIGGEISELVLVAELGNFGSGCGRGLGESRATRTDGSIGTYESQRFSVDLKLVLRDLGTSS